MSEPATALVTYPHLTIRDGVARSGDTRFKVKYLAASHHYQGWGAEELLRQYPDFTPAEVHAALIYFYDHRDAILAELEQEIREHEEGQRRQERFVRELKARWEATQEKKRG